MSEHKEYAVERKLTRMSDGAVGLILDSKLHSWEGPALVYPKESKQKPEYYIYGIQYDKEKWLELKNGGEGLPFYKTSGMKIR